jgi:tRNA dimethylallyltransferase
MAKRQITWLRSQDDGVWFDSGANLPVAAVNQYLSEQVSQLQNNA